MRDNPAMFVMVVILGIMLMLVGVIVVVECTQPHAEKASTDPWETIHEDVKRLRIDGGWIYHHATQSRNHSFYVPECAP